MKLQDLLSDFLVTVLLLHGIWVRQSLTARLEDLGSHMKQEVSGKRRLHERKQKLLEKKRPLEECTLFSLPLPSV